MSFTSVGRKIIIIIISTLFEKIASKFFKDFRARKQTIEICVKFSELLKLENIEMSFRSGEFKIKILVQKSSFRVTLKKIPD